MRPRRLGDRGKGDETIRRVKLQKEQIVQWVLAGDSVAIVTRSIFPNPKVATRGKSSFVHVRGLPCAGVWCRQY